MGLKKPLKVILRNLALLGTISSIGAGSLFAIEKCHRLSIEKEYTKMYGTKENPKYKAILEDSPVHYTFADDSREKLKLENNSLETLLKRAEYPELKLETLNDEIVGLESAVEPSDSKLQDVYQKLEFLAASISEFSPRNVHVIRQGEIASAYKSLVELLNNKEELHYPDNKLKNNLHRMVKDLTGSNFPSQLKVEINSFMFQDSPEVPGHYLFPDNEIAVKKVHYFRSLNFLLHEAGHAFSLQNENYYFNSSLFYELLFPQTFNQEQRETHILEEASAYAFANHSLNAISDEKLLSKMQVYAKTLCFEKLNCYKPDDQDVNSYSFLLADAAMTYFQDSAKAFNYLSTVDYDDLEPEIIGILDENISVFKRHIWLKNRCYSKFHDLSKKHHKLYFDYVELKSD